MSKYPNPAQFGRLNPADFNTIPNHYTESIWLDNLPSNPADYGSNLFHGRTHPDIIKVALDRYTKPKELVWDCFGGSGTTIDVCREYGNSCIANDINPTRSEILKRDSRYYRPAIGVSLVVCHPPYMDIIKYNDNDGLSTADLAEFKYSMSLVFDNVRLCLKPGRVLVLIIGTVYKQSQSICLDYELMTLLADFRLLGRVVRTFGETKGGATAGAKNENLWKYRRLKYGIWALGQDVVLFLQKAI